MSATGWDGPPTDILGCTVPVQRFVARTDHTVIALQHVTAFPEGCVLTLQVAVRRGELDEETWSRVAGHSYGPAAGLAIAEDGMRIGVRFPDGSRATTVNHSFRGWAHPADRPEPPVLVEAGSETSSGDRSYQGKHRFWLWPLPPPVPFEFVAEWRDMGIETTSILIDGSAIVLAAERALPYWS